MKKITSLDVCQYFKFYSDFGLYDCGKENPKTGSTYGDRQITGIDCKNPENKCSRKGVCVKARFRY